MDNTDRTAAGQCWRNQQCGNIHPTEIICKGDGPASRRCSHFYIAVANIAELDQCATDFFRRSIPCDRFGGFAIKCQRKCAACNRADTSNRLYRRRTLAHVKRSIGQDKAHVCRFDQGIDTPDAAINHVDTATAGYRVVAGTAGDGVVTETTSQKVEVLSAGERVVTKTAIQRDRDLRRSGHCRRVHDVGAIATGNRYLADATKGISRRRAANCGRQSTGVQSRRCDDEVGIGRFDQGINTATADNRVHTCTTSQQVVQRIAGQRIGIGRTDNVVEIADCGEAGCCACCQVDGYACQVRVG